MCHETLFLVVVVETKSYKELLSKAMESRIAFKSRGINYLLISNYNASVQIKILPFREIQCLSTCIRHDPTSLCTKRYCIQINIHIRRNDLLCYVTCNNYSTSYMVPNLLTVSFMREPQVYSSISS